MAAPGRTAAELSEALLAGDKRALARAISLVENDDPEGWALVREIYPKTGKAAVVGFTGPPGVGKSTLIGALVKNAREHEREVAVLSIDPSSPFTQGALLGDRIRLTEHFLDPGVFIRGVTFITGRPSARTEMPGVLDLVASGVIKPERVTSRVVSFDEAPEALLESNTKLVMVPSPS